MKNAIVYTVGIERIREEVVWSATWGLPFDYAGHWRDVVHFLTWTTPYLVRGERIDRSLVHTAYTGIKSSDSVLIIISALQMLRVLRVGEILYKAWRTEARVYQNTKKGSDHRWRYEWLFAFSRCVTHLYQRLLNLRTVRKFMVLGESPLVSPSSFKGYSQRGHIIFLVCNAVSRVATLLIRDDTELIHSNKFSSVVNDNRCVRVLAGSI